MENTDPNNKFNNSKNNDGRNSNGSHISLSSDDDSNDQPDYTCTNPNNNNNKSIVPFQPNLPGSNSEKRNYNPTTTVRIDKFVSEPVVEKERPSISLISRKRTSVVELVIRVFAVIACLVSFSVMAADTTPGWSGDSFHRYLQYRFCLAVNVIGFVYSGFQVVDLGCHLGRGNHIISHDLRHHFDFIMDQILAYLVMSASSSAATRVDDWISNWGSDEFTIMASASVAISFLAFIAFASSSVISGYNLCTRIQLDHS